jgi:glycosyl transferase family 25
MMNVSCYVLHVKEGYEDREASIVDQFGRLNIDFEWVLEHDKHEVTTDLLQQYGYHHFDMPPEAISCAMKHIAAWERIAAGSDPGGLILEDDVLIDIRRFEAVVHDCLAELQRDWGGRGCICFGDGGALFVPWTKLKKGRRLYRAEFARMGDSYWVDRQTAALRLAWIKQHGFYQPADHLIDTIDRALGSPIFWSVPTVVSQGSHTGLFNSSIQSREKTGWFKRLEWSLKVVRRKYIYPLLGKDMRRGDFPKKKGE